MGGQPPFAFRRKDSSLRILFLLFLLVGINTRSVTVAATMNPSDGSCSASQSCKGSKAEKESCALDTDNGMLCITNPEEIFQKCSPDDYCLNFEDFGAFVLVPAVYRSVTPGACQNDDEDCEHFAIENFDCLLNPNYMRKSCPKSCYMCFENDDGSDASLVEVPIGVKQTMPPEATEDEKTSFYKVITETASYMAEEVFAKKEFEEARRDCRNTGDLCAWKVASTNGTYCDDHKSTYLCGPACKACGNIILTEDEHQMIEECTPDLSKNIFENAEPAKGDHEDDSDDSDDPPTLDAMFRRIIGELPYPSSSEEPYPIVPGVNYTVKVLSRPSLNPKIHTNMSLDSIDFHIGGPWIVILENFLTPEECDHMIELGNLEGREQSTIWDDDLEEVPREKDEKDKEESGIGGKDAKDGVKEEKEPKWRTSTNAWCREDVCKEDPVHMRVHERIRFTTGVKDKSYYEDFQLLKYETGQYYNEHHDEVGDVHDNLYEPVGPRLLTFFLYLNDVEEGGETRFSDLMGDDSGIYLDVKSKKGRALLWPSMLNEDLLAMDLRTYHAALEVKKGEKYGANVWMHLRDFQNYDCDEFAVEELLNELSYKDNFSV